MVSRSSESSANWANAKARRDEKDSDSTAGSSGSFSRSGITSRKTAFQPRTRFGKSSKKASKGFRRCREKAIKGRMFVIVNTGSGASIPTLSATSFDAETITIVASGTWAQEIFGGCFDARTMCDSWEESMMDYNYERARERLLFHSPLPKRNDEMLVDSFTFRLYQSDRSGNPRVELASDVITCLQVANKEYNGMEPRAKPAREKRGRLI